MKIEFFFATLFILCILYANGQQAINDTIKFATDSSAFDSLNNRIDYIPQDFSLIPSELLYNHIWDNTNIRTQATTMPAKDDTIAIVLRGPNAENYVHPTPGKVISQYRTKRRKNHTGTDVKLALGDSVLCAFDGKVRLAQTYYGYGKLVLVRHNNGLETVYGHLSKICVEENQMVCAGDLIGLGGRSGRATTEHLHFETRLFGEPFDSEKYIDFANHVLKSDTIYQINKRVETSLTKFHKPTVPNNTEIIAGANEDFSVFHKIRSGDTLSGIARKYNTTVQGLCMANNITPKKTLKIGTVLKVK